MLTSLVCDILKNGIDAAAILSDWLVEFREGVPQIEIYIKKFRKPSEVTLNLLIDVISKFGEKPERKHAQRVRRLLRRMKNHKKVEKLYWNFKGLRGRKAVNWKVNSAERDPVTPNGNKGLFLWRLKTFQIRLSSSDSYMEKMKLTKARLLEYLSSANF